jgi:hypothetical protein
MNFAVLPARGLSSGLLSLWQHANPDSRDVHWSPAYGRSQEALGGRSMIAVLADRKNVLAKPFMLRPLPNGRSDIAGPYQYGGLFGDKRMVEEFERRFGVDRRQPDRLGVLPVAGQRHAGLRSGQGGGAAAGAGSGPLADEPRAQARDGQGAAGRG